MTQLILPLAGPVTNLKPYSLYFGFYSPVLTDACTIMI